MQKHATPFDLLTIGAGDGVALALPFDTFVILSLEVGICSDLAVGACVHILKLVGIKVIFGELGKMGLIFCWVLLLEHLHVLLDMAAKDALLVGLESHTDF